MSLVYSRSGGEYRANGLLVNCHPGHGLTDVWAFPDGGLLSEGHREVVGVVNVLGPEASPLIEFASEGSGLDCVVKS